MSDILGERDAAVPDVPTRVAEPSRQSQLPKRFYQNVSVVESDGRFSIALDSKPVKTPGKNPLALSSQEVSNFVAEEWRGQEERIDPMTMPVTRLANTAIDGVATDMQAVKEDIIRYAGTDLLCYRADGPEGLVAMQRDHWDPLIDWAQTSLGARFTLAEGVVHIEQTPEAIAAFSTHVGLVSDPMVLAAAHVVTSLTGSAIIALAVLKGERDLEQAWVAAHVDEDWNISQWGGDEEAEHRRSKRLLEMKAACDTIRAMV